MNKNLRKTLFTAIALGLGHGSAAWALDQPSYLECDLDGGETIETMWEDVSSGGTKYGGDVEFGFSYEGYCYDAESEEDIFSSEINIEIDLSQDADDPYFYTCDGAECYGTVDEYYLFDSLIQALEDDFEAQCGLDGGEIFDAEFSPIIASVKHMNPGKGKGPQNHTKITAECGDLF